MRMYGYEKRRAWINDIIIALNIVYFFYLETIGSSEDMAFMLRHGVMYAPLVLEDREYYRLFASIFMHFGIEHLINNMLVLFVLGDNLERAMGHLKYLVSYLLCGVGANVVSMFWNQNSYGQAVGAGASGAIFGVVGSLLYIILVNRGRLEDLDFRQLIIMIIVSLYLGFTDTNVDNAAHVAGLLLGIGLAMILYRKPNQSNDLEDREL